MKLILTFTLIVLLSGLSYSTEKINIAILKYHGGDWYSANGGVKNFLRELKKRTKLRIDTELKIVELKSEELFNYPILILNGHHAEDLDGPKDTEQASTQQLQDQGKLANAPGKNFKKRTIIFDNLEKTMLRRYIEHGGFLFVNDDYGLYYSFMEAMKDVFPEKEVVYLHAKGKVIKNILNSYYILTNIPKVHKHDGDNPEAYGVFHNGRLCVLYLYSSDVADGWETEGIYSDPKNVKERAIKFGVNLIYYVLTH